MLCDPLQREHFALSMEESDVIVFFIADEGYSSTPVRDVCSECLVLNFKRTKLCALHCTESLRGCVSVCEQ